MLTLDWAWEEATAEYKLACEAKRRGELDDLSWQDLAAMRREHYEILVNDAMNSSDWFGGGDWS